MNRAIILKKLNAIEIAPGCHCTDNWGVVIKSRLAKNAKQWCTWQLGILTSAPMWRGECYNLESIFIFLHWIKDNGGALNRYPGVKLNNVLAW